MRAFSILPAVLLLASLSALPARAEPTTLWAAGSLAAGKVRHDIDHAAGLDVDLARRGGLVFAASVGYIHALTADAGNIHRFPSLRSSDATWGVV